MAAANTFWSTGNEWWKWESERKNINGTEEKILQRIHGNQTSQCGFNLFTFAHTKFGHAHTFLPKTYTDSMLTEKRITYSLKILYK